MTSKQRDELQRISASFVTYPIGYGFLNLNCEMPLKEIKHIVDTILAEPLRNCDVGTAEEQSVRMSEFCREQYKKTDGVALCSGCRFHNLEGLDCQFAWAQMPYEKEGEE